MPNETSLPRVAWKTQALSLSQDTKTRGGGGGGGGRKRQAHTGNSNV